MLNITKRKALAIMAKETRKDETWGKFVKVELYRAKQHIKSRDEMADRDWLKNRLYSLGYAVSFDMVGVVADRFIAEHAS